MGWQRHQLDHMQIICTSLQTDNHTSTSPLSFYGPDTLPAAQPTVSKHWRWIGPQEDVGFQSMLELYFRDGGRVQMFQKTVPMTKAATLKLHLLSSLAVLGMARSPCCAERRPAWPKRCAISMQTCWKYAGAAPQMQFQIYPSSRCLMFWSKVE